MKERPILFSGPMVRAILEGRKTQTRRIVNKKLPSSWNLAGGPCLYHPIAEDEDGEEEPGPEVFGAGFEGDDGDESWIPCRHGGPGDRLFVKEALESRRGNDGAHWAHHSEGGQLAFDECKAAIEWRWKRKRLPGMFMPREAARILLEITEVRVQRVQEISEEDVIAEGMDRAVGLTGMSGATHKIGDPIRSFHEVWEEIHGPGAWDSNPWVWAITFRRVQ